MVVDVVFGGFHCRRTIYVQHLSICSLCQFVSSQNLFACIYLVCYNCIVWQYLRMQLSSLLETINISMSMMLVHPLLNLFLCVYNVKYAWILLLRWPEKTNIIIGIVFVEFRCWKTIHLRHPLNTYRSSTSILSFFILFACNSHVQLQLHDVFIGVVIKMIEVKTSIVVDVVSNGIHCWVVFEYLQVHYLNSSLF